MYREDILKRILHVAEQHNVLNADEIKEIDEQTPINDYLDSMDETELVMFIEREFDIAITDAEVENCTTFGDVVAIVDQRLL